MLSKTPDYVEISFKIPFYDMYFLDESWDETKFEKDTTELSNLAKALNINLDCQLLYEKYSENFDTESNIIVFYSKRKNTFIYFDLTKDKYDQMAMITFGVKVPFAKYSSIKKLMFKLYLRGGVHTNIIEDYFHHQISKSIAENENKLKQIFT